MAGRRPGIRPISIFTILDFGGFDSSRILISRGGIPRSIGNLLEVLSQAILVGIIGRLGVAGRMEREAERQRVREAERQRGKEAERQRGREAERQRDKEGDGERERESWRGRWRRREGTRGREEEGKRGRGEEGKRGRGEEGKRD